MAHEQLDRAVLAAYAAVDPEGGWSEDWAAVWVDTGAGQPLPADHPLAATRAEVDQNVLANLLRLNGQRSTGAAETTVAEKKKKPEADSPGGIAKAGKLQNRRRGRTAPPDGDDSTPPVTPPSESIAEGDGEPNPDEIEDKILIPCALRFDGYKYEEQSGFMHQEAFARFDATGKLPERREELLTLFFMLQRWFYKWGGGPFQRNRRDWSTFRTLFLMVWDDRIPAEFALTGGFSAPWDRLTESERTAAVRFVREIHEKTHYQPGKSELAATEVPEPG